MAAASAASVHGVRGAPVGAPDSAASTDTGAEGVAEWTVPLLDGKPPPARGGQAGLLIGNLFIVFGGTFFKEKFRYLNDLWVVDTDSMQWHKPSAEGRAPSARYGHAAAVVGTSVYVFGGKGPGSSVHNDLHRLDVERWTWSLVPSTTAPPLGRFGHSMAAVGDKLVMFGGWDGSTMFNDLWVFDTAAASWVKPAVDGPPPSPRHGHSLLLAPAANRLVVWGGWAESPRGLPDYRSDGRALNPDTMTWERLRVTGERPTGRYWHSAGMVADRYMVVCGGWGASEMDASAKEAAAASQAAGVTGGASAAAGRTGLAARAAAAAAAAPRRSRSLWVLDTVERVWAQPVAAGRHLGVRYGQSLAVLGPFGLLFGGWDGVKSRADITQLDLTPVLGDVGSASIADDASAEAAAAEHGHQHAHAHDGDRDFSGGPAGAHDGGFGDEYGAGYGGEEGDYADGDYAQ